MAQGGGNQMGVPVPLQAQHDQNAKDKDMGWINLILRDWKNPLCYVAGWGGRKG